MVKKWQRGEIATIITLGALVVLGVSTLVSSVFLNNQNKQTTKTKAADITTCRDNPDLERTPAGYYWKADCNKPCTTDNDCPKSTSGYVNPDTSRWCYGFDGPNKSSADWRCMQLQYGSAPAQQNPPAQQQPPAQEQTSQSTGDANACASGWSCLGECADSDVVNLFTGANGGDNQKGKEQWMREKAQNEGKPENTCLGGSSTSTGSTQITVQSCTPGQGCRYPQLDGDETKCYEGTCQPDKSCIYEPGKSTGKEVSCEGSYTSSAPSSGGSTGGQTTANKPGEKCIYSQNDDGTINCYQGEYNNNGICEWKAGLGQLADCASGALLTSSSKTEEKTGGGLVENLVSRAINVGTKFLPQDSNKINNELTQVSVQPGACKLVSPGITLLNGGKTCANNWLISCNNGFVTQQYCSSGCDPDVRQCLTAPIISNGPNQKAESSSTYPTFAPGEFRQTQRNDIQTSKDCTYKNFTDTFTVKNGAVQCDITRNELMSCNNGSLNSTKCSSLGCDPVQNKCRESEVIRPTVAAQVFLQDLILTNNTRSQILVETIVGTNILIQPDSGKGKIMKVNELATFNISDSCKAAGGNIITLKVIYQSPMGELNRKMKDFGSMICSGGSKIYAITDL